MGTACYKWHTIFDDAYCEKVILGSVAIDSQVQPIICNTTVFG